MFVGKIIYQKKKIHTYNYIGKSKCKKIQIFVGKIIYQKIHTYNYIRKSKCKKIQIFVGKLIYQKKYTRIIT